MVDFNLLSPYTIDKMVRGVDVLEKLKALSGATSDTYAYQSARITNAALEKGLRFYRMAIDKFLGNSLMSRLETCSDGDFVAHLKPGTDAGLGDWIDVAGLIAPHACVRAILNDVESGAIDSCGELSRRFACLHERYYEYEWTWAYRLMLSYFGLNEGEITTASLAAIVRRWLDSVLTLDRCCTRMPARSSPFRRRRALASTGSERRRRPILKACGAYSRRIRLSRRFSII